MAEEKPWVSKWRDRLGSGRGGKFKVKSVHFAYSIEVH